MFAVGKIKEEEQRLAGPCQRQGIPGRCKHCLESFYALVSPSQASPKIIVDHGCHRPHSLAFDVVRIFRLSITRKVTPLAAHSPRMRSLRCESIDEQEPTSRRSNSYWRWERT